MNTAKMAREATELAQRDNQKISLSRLFEQTTRTVNAAIKNGEYQATVRTVGYSLTDISLVIEFLKKNGYVAKKASQEPFIDVSW